MNIPGQCDVVVVGGGPAGSLAAALVSSAGHDVVLLEKQRHPRATVGESLIPDFWKYCDDAGVSEKILAEGFLRKSGGTVDWHGERRRLAFGEHGFSRPALHVERDRFDHILIGHARTRGAKVFEQVSVQDIALGESESTVNYRTAGGETGCIKCRIVVDASGQASLIARQLGLRVLDDDFRFMSVWGYFRNSKYYAGDQEIHGPEECATVPPTTYTASVPGTGDWGWCWHIMLRESASVGLVLPLDAIKTVKDSKRSWERFLREQCDALTSLRILLADATLIDNSVKVIRDYSYRCTKVAGPGYFLVGDAAGFIDPIFSIGVVLGMYSAKAASWAIDRTLRAPEQAERYRSIFSSQIQQRMELARTLALPQYDLHGQASEQARTVMKFSGANAKSLMRAASSLTDRSQHYHALVDESRLPGAPAGVPPGSADTAEAE